METKENQKLKFGMLIVYSYFESIVSLNGKLIPEKLERYQVIFIERNKGRQYMKSYLKKLKRSVFLACSLMLVSPTVFAASAIPTKFLKVSRDGGKEGQVRIIFSQCEVQLTTNTLLCQAMGRAEGYSQQQLTQAEASLSAQIRKNNVIRYTSAILGFGAGLYVGSLALPPSIYARDAGEVILGMVIGAARMGAAATAGATVGVFLGQYIADQATGELSLTRESQKMIQDASTNSTNSFALESPDRIQEIFAQITATLMSIESIE
jgi:hypothetical protein